MLQNIPTPLQSVNMFLSEIQRQIAEQVAQTITAQLEEEVEAWLHRGYHERREVVPNVYVVGRKEPAHSPGMGIVNGSWSPSLVF